MPRGWVLARFYRPGAWGFELFARGLGNSPTEKIALRFCSGEGGGGGGAGMVRLGIDRYIILYSFQKMREL